MDTEELKTKILQLETAALTHAQKQIPLWVKIALAGVLVALLIAAATAGYYYLRHEHASLMTEEKIRQSAELAKVLEVSQSTAKKLTAELVAAKDRQPNSSYIVQAPTVEQAAVQVKKEIDQGKSQANKIPADKTVVTANTKEQKVDVYRITLDKARWGVNVLVLAGGNESAEFGGGIAYHNKDWAVNAGGTNRGRIYMMGIKYF